MVSTITKKEIADMALGHLGQEPLSTFEDNTRNGRAIRIHYESARIAALEEAKWSFARKRVLPGLLAAEPEFEWSYKFELPSDFIKEQLVKNTSGTPIDYTVESNQLLADVNVVRLVYTWNNELPSTYSAKFIEYLSYKLAWKAAYMITQSRSEEQAMLKACLQMLPAVISSDGYGENDADPIGSSSWLDGVADA